MIRAMLVAASSLEASWLVVQNTKAAYITSNMDRGK